MSKGGGTKVQTYDPSVKDAEIRRKQSDLTDEVTKEAFKASKNANIYSEAALNSLNEGLGLLSKYLDTRVQGERTGLSLSEDAVKRATKLRQQAKAGGGLLVGMAESGLMQAEQMDKMLYSDNGNRGGY